MPGSLHNDDEQSLNQTRGAANGGRRAGSAGDCRWLRQRGDGDARSTIPLCGIHAGRFDCSGLVVYAAARVGLTLPRTAHEQLHAGSPIDRREVRGGDLVFMRLGSKDLHVGIALDALRFVHAPSSGGRVRIDYLDRPPYVRAFLNARRVADNTSPHVR